MMTTTLDLARKRIDRYGGEIDDNGPTIFMDECRARYVAEHDGHFELYMEQCASAFADAKAEIEVEFEANYSYEALDDFEKAVVEQADRFDKAKARRKTFKVVT